MGSPVRFPYGVTNVAKTNPLGSFIAPDPTAWHVFFDDFDQWVTDTSSAAKYTITTTEAGAGSATEALADAKNGVLVLTTDNADNDLDFLQKIGETFLPESGKQTIFKARFKCDAATEVEWYMGLMVTDTDPLSSTAGGGVTDGIFFMKEDGSTSVNFYVQKNATTGQLTTTGVATAAADTWVTLAFAFDGKRYVGVYVDDVLVKTVDLTTTLSTYLPDTELTVSFGLKNGEAAATKALSVDYIFCAEER